MPREPLLPFRPQTYTLNILPLSDHEARNLCPESPGTGLAGCHHASNCEEESPVGLRKPSGITFLLLRSPTLQFVFCENNCSDLNCVLPTRSQFILWQRKIQITNSA